MPPASIRKLLTAVFALSLLPLILTPTQAQSAIRPFPKYELTFEKIVGQVDPNWNPDTGEGDGCVRSDNPQIEHLTTYAFRGTLEPCEGVRTKVRFFIPEGTEAGTLEFRFGTTWQYVPRAERNRKKYIPKPVENFLYDGEPTDIYKPDEAIVRDKSGNLVRMSSGTGFFEPVHFIFEDEFEVGHEHVIQYDAYLPANADWGGLTWGTGSTGDTGGGSIGAKANGLTVSPTAGMDFRYVLDSEYRAALGLPASTGDAEADKLPARPNFERFDESIEGTNLTLVDCLEGQQLREKIDSLPISQIYPEMEGRDEVVPFRDKVFSAGLSAFDYDFYVWTPGQWQIRGLRPMNWSEEQEKFLPHLNDDGTYKVVPYKPTLASLEKEIPGYHLVTNDIEIFPDGEFDHWKPGGIPVWKSGPNVVLDYHASGADTQHFYFTYAPNPGTFELVKTDGRGKPVAGAQFELYRVIGDLTPTACGVEPDLELIEEAEVCDVVDITGEDELRDFIANKPQRENCHTEKIQRVTLTGADGPVDSFVTGVEGTFTPHQVELLPGRYLLRETSVPEGHVKLNEWYPFEIGLQTGEVTAVRVSVANPVIPPPSEEPPVTPPPSEEPPVTPPPSEEPPVTPPPSEEPPVTPPPSEEPPVTTPPPALPPTASTPPARVPGLPTTGANVTVLAVLGLGLLGTGTVFVLRRQCS